VLVLAAVLTACSVSTPRDGFPAGEGSGSVTGVAAATAGNAGAVDGAPTVAGASAATPSNVAAPAAAIGATPGGGTNVGTAAAATPGDTTGVTANSITISILAGFTGSYGSLMKLIADNGYGLWADEINAAGGINGRKIVLKMVDNHDTAEGGVAACKEVQSNGSFLAVSLAGLGGADMSSSDCLDHAGIPVFGLNLAGYRSGWKHVISMNDDGKQAAALASFIKNVIGDGAGKVGIIAVNDPIHLAAKSQLSADLTRLHMTHVRDELVSVAQGSFVAELSRLRDAGATTVAILTGNEAIGIVRDAKAINYSPHFTGVLWTLDEFSQAAGALWSGIKAIRVWPTTDSPAYASYQAKAHKYGRDAFMNSTVMAVYGGGLVLSELIKRAGAGLSRESVVAATDGVVNYDNGIIALSFKPGNRLADIKAFPLVCCNSDNTWKGTGPAAQEF
jgi:ABC-type branched-subunit amino acid transport system substrate-binding protein